MKVARKLKTFYLGEVEPARCIIRLKCSHYKVVHCKSDVDRNICLDRIPALPHLGVVLPVEVAHEHVPAVADHLPPAGGGAVLVVFLLVQFDLDSWCRLASSGELTEPETLL